MDTDGIEKSLMKAKKENDRVVYFDYLRIFAALAVIMLHVASQKWKVTNVNGFEWKTFNFFDSIVRWGVPVFTMISGALFLEREIPLKKIYSKYILRMVIAFVFWSCIYMLFNKGTNVDKLAQLIRGHYHLWFVPMIIGLYMCIPVIKPIIKDKSKTKYFLILALIFASIIPELVTLVKDFGGKNLIKIVSAANDLVNKMTVKMVLGYVGYFILGFYLNKIELKKNHRFVIYVLGIIGAIFTIVMDLLVALKLNKCCDHYYINFNVNILFESIAIFTLFKYLRLKPNKFISKLSKYSFGAYLVHVLVLEQLNARCGLNTLSFNPVLSVLAITCIVFIISFVVSAILNHIPLVKKYIV